MPFTDNLRALMNAKGVSRRKMASDCGISPSAVNSWFNRSAENISLPTLLKLSEYFGVTILTKVLDEYHALDVRGKNDLLKMIIETITYRKHESGSDIEPELEFRLLI